MAGKCKETRNRSIAVQGENGSGFPLVGCASEYITSAARMQEEINRKFTPKRERAEKVAELYEDLGARYDLDAERVDGYAFSVDDSTGEAFGHHPVLDYLRFWGRKGEDRLWRWFHFETADRILENCRFWLKRWYDVHASAMENCGSYLEFRLTPDEARLYHANFCRDKFCPLCNWRRSLKVYHQVSAIMGRVEDEDFLKRVDLFDGGRLRYLFLTLTIRNVWGGELTRAVQALYDGWRVLYHSYMRGPYRTAEKRLKDVVVGSFRALEVTVSDGKHSKGWAGSFHPHLHVILAVRETYFERGHYLTEQEWSQIWGKACGLDYNPSIKIEAVRPNADTAGDLSAPLDSSGGGAGKDIAYAGAVAELSKYPLKDADFVGADEKYHESRGQYLQWLLEALRGRRLIGMTGCFGKAARELRLDDMEDGDLVHVNPDEIRADVRYLLVKYHWRYGAYVRGQVTEIDPAQFVPDGDKPDTGKDDGRRWNEGGDWTPQPDDIAADERLASEDVTPEAARGRKRERRKQVKGQVRIPNWAKL